ncbi:hypothetical protein [uncultured Tolumonas sp.]|uniref:hypothetical protein n=1 Tax=uncultured Tolumonas sp. TaxID=263765 RepID=UPI002A0A9DC9|nr:hypothetical protein [uncultured Tolumonas sp.]
MSLLKNSTKFVCFSLISINFNATAEILNLCSNDENIIFSCVTKKKIISICEIKQQANQSKIQYRFGTSNRIDFAYPDDLSHYKPSSFTRSFTKWDNGSASLFINFKNGKYTYTIYSDLVIGETEAMNEDKTGEYGHHAGITVNRNEKEISDIKCNTDIPNVADPWDVIKTLEPLIPNTDQ